MTPSPSPCLPSQCPRPHPHWRPLIVLPSQPPRTQCIGRFVNDSDVFGITSPSNRCSPSISFPVFSPAWPHRTWIWRRHVVWIWLTRRNCAMRWRCGKRQTIQCKFGQFEHRFFNVINNLIISEKRKQCSSWLLEWQDGRRCCKAACLVSWSYSGVRGVIGKDRF